MRGSIKPAGDGVWRLRVDTGRDANGKRRQKMITLKGTKKEAQAKLRDMCSGAEDGTFVDPSKQTLGSFLEEWITAQETAGKLRASTLARYRDVVTHASAADIGRVPVQKLRETQLERYYATVTAGSRHIFHAVVRRALRRALKERLIAVNPAADMDNAPRRARQRLSDDAEVNCWTADDARRFLQAAKRADTQTAGLFALALDSGARKSELLALRWTDVDLDAAQVTIARQLVKSGTEPVFGPTKTGATRTLAVNAETIRLLKAHRRQQSELKMANRTAYHDFGLVFAKEWGQAFTRKDLLGAPLERTHVGHRMFDRLIAKAGVKRITLHGLRHTAGTLMLLAGVPVHVVAARLGHANTHTTLAVYAHVLRDAHADAAKTLGAVLHADTANG